MKISVVVRCKNEEAFIERCLTGICKQKGSFGLEVIIVDSGSTDHTLDICRKFSPKIVLINPDQFTFGYACNAGVAASTGDLVAFISAHSYPKTCMWLETLSEPFLSDPYIVASAGYDLCLERPTSPMADWHREFYMSKMPEPYDLSLNKPFISNSNAMYRTEYLQLNPFDETVLGAEDVLWLARTLQSDNNVRIVFVPNAICHHYHEPSIREKFNRMWIHGRLHCLDNMPPSLNIQSWLRMLLGLTLHYYEYLWWHRNVYSWVWFLKVGAYSFAEVMGYLFGRLGKGTLTLAIAKMMRYEKLNMFGVAGDRK